MNPEQQHLLDPSNSQTARGAISRTTARLKSILHRARRTLIAACIAVVLIAVAVAVVKFHIFPTPPPAPGKVLKELEHHRNRWNLPGAAVVAVKDYGETVLIKSGLGVRNSDGDPVTTKSLFHIGSTTKAMQAFAMLRLAERGILDMNSHIKSYRPSFSLNDSAATNLVSLVDLLSHRTGLPTSDLLLFLSNTTIEMFDKRLASWELSYEFRSGYAYQNFMHMLAGLVASDVYYNTTTSGPTANYDNWYNMMKKELFEPLGMKHTTGNIKEWMADDLRSSAAKVDVDPTTGIPNKSKGWLDPLYSIWLYWGAPAGSVTSNVDDLAKYLRFVLKLGQKEDGTRILSESAFRNAFAPHNTYMTSFEKFPPGSEKPYYGLGWIVTSYRGKRMVYHTGGTEMTCMVCLLPDDGFGAFVLTNNVGRWAGPACYHLIDR
ncbi:beta-lactamase/transpeptidase-like protein [Cladochytrium replicatum]|nr:beta-lactamase/transpeptidase-like protein [Cladochytrium replicatum]